ncbi:MAG: HEAT repeat domain-containing protein [Myxococcota bacterium]|nr:HEAT repeat domain-containing protein [Myxococcota bacterium]
MQPMTDSSTQHPAVGFQHRPVGHRFAGEISQGRDALVGLLEQVGSSLLTTAERVAALDAVRAILIGVGDDEIASNILWALASDAAQDNAVRVAASRALLSAGNQDFIRTITNKLKRPEPQTVSGAARALGVARRREAVPMLMELVGTTTSPYILSEALWALGEIGDGRAEDLVRRALIQERCRAAAIEALGKLGGVKSLKEVVPCIEHDDERLRLGAAKALERLLVRHREQQLDSIVATIVDRIVLETQAEVSVVLTGCLRILGAPVPKHVTGRILNASLGRVTASQGRTRSS